MPLFPPKFLAIATAVMVVAVLGIAATIGLHVRFEGDAPHRSTVSVYASGQTTVVEPLAYCDLAALGEIDRKYRGVEISTPAQNAELQAAQSAACDPTGTPPIINANAGDTVQMSLPKEISGAPFNFLALYGSLNGTFDVVEINHSPGERRSLSLPTVDDQGLPLSVVEFKLPMGVINPETGQEQFVPHAVWSFGVAVSE
ncbi:DUF2771 domain-containing protein [Hoyosella rhizosphaerae]|uniref:DUF2771 domain-containing protein n=1 Tax=Hoyosella rhizosphaerae TaxID=1755582 RepID=A0A916XI02_9ACTN|nr:DUF2771 family protein [Hoyosella rhizosphaerae]MBN4928196.1 DUF2771 domain-containing protein [Hoyosella rhizosphaerae]GGC73130.1 hypothetical protein GCM10011410_27810 [Hoyosella rhizosphaerae]